MASRCFSSAQDALAGWSVVGVMLTLIAVPSSRAQATDPGLRATDPGAQATGPGAQAADQRASALLDDWARDLVAPPLGRSGDRGAVVARWFERLAEDPRHPLAEATLRLMRLVRPDLQRPDAFRASALALDPHAFGPLARHQLELIQGRARADLPGAGRGPDLYPQLAPSLEVLGPLPPLADPGALAADPESMVSPGFGEQHEGLDGPAEWVRHDRGPADLRVSPVNGFIERDGWALMALRFDVPGGGPAYIEVDLGGAGGGSFTGSLGAVFAYGGSAFRGHVLGAGEVPVGYGLSLNGAAPKSVDLSTGSYSAVQHHPVVLADGRNELLLRVSLDRPVAPLIRVLDTDGAPVADLSWAHDERPVGRTLRLAPPGPWRLGSRFALAQISDPSPMVRALRGLLAALDRRPAEGLADLLEALAQDDDPALAATVAGVVERMAYLPDVWRRGRSRQLVEAVRAQDADHLPMGLAWAGILAAEDRDEEAIDLLRALADTWPEHPAPLLRLSDVYSGLDMDAQARLALFDAFDRAPQSPRVLASVASFWRGKGYDRRALEVEVALQSSLGLSANSLESSARRLATAGDLDGSLAAWEDALSRTPSAGRRLRFAHVLLGAERLNRAAALIDGLIDDFPRWSDPWLARADHAALTGDIGGEVNALREVLAREPSLSVARARLASIMGVDETSAFFARYDIDGAELIAAYDPDGQEDSVVRLLDLGLVRLFADGVSETYTHELIQVRDLDACNSEGTLRLRGEVLKVATIKADGTVFEPLRLSGEYVMPNLEPGDFIETITRTRQSAPRDEVSRLGSWFFTSISEPFQVSRYVVRLPAELPLRLEVGQFDGQHEVLEAGSDQVHFFERRDGRRVVTEPGVPGPRRFLPWVEFGMDRPWEPVLSFMRLGLDPLALVTPEIEAAARDALAGVTGQEAQARALHHAVGGLLDQRYRSPSPAVTSLLAREGNPTVLYAALLAAAGIERDFVWSLAAPPAADEEGDEPFAEPARFRQRLLLVVRPDDGPAAWCDLTYRTLPYGHLPGDNSGAQAVLVKSGALLSVPSSDVPGNDWHLEGRVAADGSAQIEGSLSLLGGPGFMAREQLGEYPDAYHQPIVQGVAAGSLDGLDMTSHEITGLDEGDEQGVAFRWTGDVPRFLDGAAGMLSRPLPLSRLELAPQVAIEGARQLPFLSRGLGIERTEFSLDLDPGLELVDPPEGLSLSYGGWTYDLSLAEESAGRWVLRREMRREPFAIAADDYAGLVDFCTAVDTAEGARLQLRRRD